MFDNGGLIVGDPVQMIGYPQKLGRVTGFTKPINGMHGTTIAMPFVRFVGKSYPVALIPRTLQVCSCVIRVPSERQI